METSNISTEVERLLEEYKALLDPAVYFFVGSQDKVVIVKEPYTSPEFEKKYGVTFGFYEKGFPPDDLVEKGDLSWVNDFPFCSHVRCTSTSFQERLVAFLKVEISQKIGGAGTGNA